jgi:hypothetical protein
LGILIIGSILYYFINPDWAEILWDLSHTYVYFIWKGNQFSK